MMPTPRQLPRTSLALALVLPVLALSQSGAWTPQAHAEDRVERQASQLLLQRAVALLADEQFKSARERAELARELHDGAAARLLLARCMLAVSDCRGAAPLLETVDVDALPPAARADAELVLLEGRVACRALAGETRVTAGMVLLPGGTFSMGSARGDEDERPVHQVALAPFWLDETEVTVGEFARCVDAGGCRWREFRTSSTMKYCNYGDTRRREHPMNCVSHAGAVQYCAWRGGRLPTEAEWEFAARGVTGRPFPWGDEPPSCARAVMEDSVNDGCGQDSTAPVRSRPSGATPEGIHDLAGNVWEWVADRYAVDYYRRSPQRAPRGPATGQRRVMRGGSWLSADPNGLRSANRDSDRASYVGNGVGFRCAKDE